MGVAVGVGVSVIVGDGCGVDVTSDSSGDSDVIPAGVDLVNETFVEF
jgi:hypothetical protein